VCWSEVSQTLTFAHNDRNPLDDSEFVPILDMLIESFAQVRVGAPLVQHLRRYACELYHQGCLEPAPETKFQANMQIVFSYLPASGRKRWRPWISRFGLLACRGARRITRHARRCPHPLHQHRRVARPVALAIEVLRYTLLAERE
jgi:hypothetical protein